MSKLKLRRLTAGISGSVLCAKAGLSRSRLSLIERGYIAAPADELKRLEFALDELIRAKAAIQKMAAGVGWPQGEIR